MGNFCTVLVMILMIRKTATSSLLSPVFLFFFFIGFVGLTGFDSLRAESILADGSFSNHHLGHFSSSRYGTRNLPEFFLSNGTSVDFQGGFIALEGAGKKKAEDPENQSGDNSEDEFVDEFEDDEGFEVYDPWESMNRKIFAFNDFFFTYFVNPLARVNDFFLPEALRYGIKNFFNNLNMPLKFICSLLQFKIAKAGNEVLNFVINSTVGLGGLVNVTDQIPSLKTSPEDFGQTFATWSIPPGPYLQLPFLGALNVRDSFGFTADFFSKTHPWIIKIFLIDGLYLALTANIGVYLYLFINSVSLNLGEYEDLKENSMDSYIMFKNVYAQYRDKQIRE